ncbi:MAG: MBL fold metallo-hydrolase [Actinomycetota bacterium]
MLDITFYGVRGSTPCSGDHVARYGGNTSCVVVSVPDEPPIICDLGTGLRYFGADVADRGDGGPFRATALVTHLHRDHVQGLPFFGPILQPDAELTIVGPVQDGQTLEAAICEAIAPPMFPVPLSALPGHISFRELRQTCLPIGSAVVSVFDVPHVGPTNGYRIDVGGASVAYLSDFQQPLVDNGEPWCPAGVLTAVRGVDVLIHDAQYDHEEFAKKATWGHCTVTFAVDVARAAGAKRLVLFHHDPLHDDDWIDRAVAEATDRADGEVEVLAAREGLTLRSESTRPSPMTPRPTMP